MEYKYKLGITALWDKFEQLTINVEFQKREGNGGIKTEIILEKVQI